MSTLNKRFWGEHVKGQLRPVRHVVFVEWTDMTRMENVMTRYNGQ